MKKVNCSLFAVIFLSLFLMGCASGRKITYSLGKDILSDKATGKNVVVDVFEDVRPSDEKLGIKEVPNNAVVTKDSDFRGDVATGASEMLVDHLAKSGLFNHVIMKDIDDHLDQKFEEMQKLATQGFDLAILGKIKHFYGYQSLVVPAASMFGLFGVMTETFANPKTVGAKTQYTDIKVIDLKLMMLIWQGEIDDEFDDKVKFYDGNVSYSLKSLKQANKKLIQKLEDVL